ncbi:MAG: alpha/beta hydrolase [Sphingobium sp.]
MKTKLLIAATLAMTPSLPMAQAKVASPAQSAVRVLAPVKIWPGGVRAVEGWPGYDHAPVTETLSADGDTVTNVSDPTFQPFLPAPGKASGTAVIIAPGGGFRQLSIRKEGTELAQWLAERGVAAFVLKYRLAPIAGEMRAFQKMLWGLPRGLPGKAAVVDGLEALRLIRAQAETYGIRANRIGVIGFSAGGHVAGMMAVDPDPAVRPDFAGLIYGMPYEGELVALPAPFLPQGFAALEAPLTAPPRTPAPGHLPPLFMAMAQDDRAAEIGFRAFYDRLYDAGYRPELHLYQRGGHGFGMRPQGSTSDRFAEQFFDWMVSERLTKP